MDISVFKAICRELEDALPGARLADMAESGTGELCITFKKPGKKTELLVCPRPDMPRIHICSGRPCRSKTLTPSVQAIRNRITGSSVVSVVQQGLERAVSLHLARKTRQGEEKAELVFEMAGKKPNLIVLDEEGRVAVAQTYVPLSDDTPRPVLPGLMYLPPPMPDKLDPYTLTSSEIAVVIDENPGLTPEKALFRRIGGISPLLAGEALSLAGGHVEPEKLRDALSALLDRVENGPYSPSIIRTGRGLVLAAFELARYSGLPRETYAAMSQAAEEYYRLLGEKKLIEDTRRSLVRQTAKQLDSARRKQAALDGDMSRSENADTYTRYGNLLMAQLQSVPEGADEVELDDLFSDGPAKATIPLDPKLSPVKNAQRYFNMARKAVSGAKMISKRLDAAISEVGLLESRLEAISRAEGIEELGRFAEGGGRARRPGRTAGRAEARLPQFPGFVSSDGYEVLYGKNARANDLLTFKLAEPMDLWLHAQGYHGAHVIVRNPERRPDIPLNTILEAAGVAAYFSDARKDSSVAVDYTFKKYVRKPRDPVSGQAIFTQNKTVFVEPARPSS